MPPVHPCGASWPDSIADLEKEQVKLGAAAPEPWILGSPSCNLRVAGCFVCFPSRILPGGSETGSMEQRRGRAGDPGWAAAALFEKGRCTAVVTVQGQAMAAYDPGHLAMREGPLLEEAVRSLPGNADVLLVNATGWDHPRRAGMAVHLGARLNVPTVGITNRLLHAVGDWPQDAAGSQAEFRLHDEIVGLWLRVRSGVRPLAIHAAWRTDVPTALAVVRSCLGRARTPEPLRRARRAAREARQRYMHREDSAS